MDDKKTTWIYRVLRWFIWLFSPKYRLEGTENLPEEPCVIVGNHCQMYGPIAGELYTPGKHYVWCAGEMMHWDEISEYAYRDFWSGKPKGTHWFYRLLSVLIRPLAMCLFNNAHTIAVYHDTRLISTFRDSIEKLKNGNSIVIFPEHYDEHNNIIHDFQDKFTDLARFYYKKTGISISFVPMYLAPKLKTMYFGSPIQYQADAEIKSERRRICDELMDEITRMATSLPEHTVIPYPNVSKRYYLKNIPLEVYDHEEKTG